MKFFKKNIEVFIILLLLAAFGLVKLVLADKFAFLNLYFIPVLLAGYYLGKRPAILTSIASVLLTAVFFIRWPAELVREASSQLHAGLNLIVWACFLILVTIMVGTINENKQRRMATATMELLEKYLRRATNGNGRESHVIRVASLAVAIAKELRIPSDVMAGIEAAGLLHDVGDTAEGFDLVEASDEAIETKCESPIGAAVPIIVATRKRSTKHGHKTAIQMCARILAIADAYDELISREERTEPLIAVKTIEHEGRFDKTLINALKHVLQKQANREPVLNS